MDIAPPDDAVFDAPLIAELPAPGPVVERSEIVELGLTDWRLANGVRVLVKPTAFKADEIRFVAWSDGGYASVSDEHYVAARTATSIRGRSGLGAFEAAALNKRLAGAKVNVSTNITNHGEKIGGSSSVADLEIALQLLHLGITEPRFDPLGLALERKSREASIRNRLADPGAVLGDAFTAIEWGGHPRYAPWTLETLDQLDLDASARIYAERFADAADFTFLFVGNVDPATLEPLVAQYLGSLPAAGGGEVRGDDGARRVTGVHSEVVRKGLDPQARVRIRFHGPMEDDWLARNQLYSTQDVLSVLLREELREELGGVYGVGVRASTSQHPESTYTFTLSWTCDPERVEELKAAAYGVIERVRNEGVQARYVDDEKAKNRRERETSIESNGFWLGGISNALSNGWDPLEILSYDERNEALTPAAVQAAAHRYLDPSQRIEVVLLPEADAAAE
jgi:zinc protease